MEVLTVLSILSFLVAILLPGLAGAREQGRSTVCRSNIRQIAMANDLYTYDSSGAYCPGASDFLKNLNRWHGVRNAINEAFDPSRGLLAPYLGADGAIRSCPTFEPEVRGFEAGNGGYGYNNAFIGVRVAATPPDGYTILSDRSGALVNQVATPGKTVMFTDTAFVAGTLIEYSFVEPRFHPEYNWRADPSIHFRHAKSANVAWCDGHVSTETRTYTYSSGFYAGDPQRLNVGWFGKTDDNRLFDLE